jgi:rhomboid family GlyGly-CTERM serine protease
VAGGFRLSRAALQRPVDLGAPGWAFVALAALLMAGAAGAWFAPAALLDWQPALAASQPWRAWTAVFVHWSQQHLAANIGAGLIVAAYGFVARVPWWLTLAWLAAWPLTQVLLLVQLALAHYGGLSGVLHAGVAIATLWLVVAEHGRRRAVGWAMTAGLAAKLLLEEPWGAPLRHPAEWDIAIAPLAHATGSIAGIVCAGAALVLRRRGRRVL